MAKATAIEITTTTLTGVNLELTLKEAKALRHLLRHVGGWDENGGLRQTLNGILEEIRFVEIGDSSEFSKAKVSAWITKKGGYDD